VQRKKQRAGFSALQLNGSSNNEYIKKDLCMDVNKDIKLGSTVEEIICAFPQWVTLKIHTVFPGEFRIGYQFKNREYIPGGPSYYSLEEALLRCYAAFCHSEGEVSAASEILLSLNENNAQDQGKDGA
jgi:hypothetical protein